MESLPAPEAVLEFVAFNCRRTCNRSESCSCYINKLICTDACSCNCTKNKEKEDVENDSSDEDDVFEDCSDEEHDEY